MGDNINEMTPSQKKRRSKNDLVGRSFKCNLCNKSYLSYPALYTHAKTKHSNNPIPVKSLHRKTQKNTECYQGNQFSYFFQTHERKGVTEDFLGVIRRIIMKMNEVIGWGFGKPEDHPLLQTLITEDVAKMCDQVFMEYFQDAAKLANESYFAKICAVVLGYRECLNKYGWEKLFEQQHKDSKCEDNSLVIETCMDHNSIQQIMMKNEYSQKNDADRLPEVANEFVTLFIKEYNLGMTKKEIISITMNMCEWLFTNKYTKTQVMLI